MKNKTALTLSTLLFPCMLWAQSEGHQLDMHQEGNQLEAVVVQEGGGQHSLSIEQFGENSFIRVNQSREEDLSGPGQKASIRQVGNYNIGVLEQSLESKEASLEQIGNYNEAYLSQPTFLDGDLEVIQHGDGNYANIAQHGYRSSSLVEQLGDDGIVNQTEGGINNSISVRQLEGSVGAEADQNVSTSGMPRSFYYNSASIQQGAGLQNYASQNLYGVESSMNASQVGDFNQSIQLTSGFRLGNHVRQNGIANYAGVGQSGRYHYSSVGQTGSDNQAFISQSGDPYDRFTSNSTLLTQTGQNNLATFDQVGGGHAWVTQVGNFNELNVTHRNSGHSNYVDAINLYADQEGDYNTLDITQIGIDRAMMVGQFGNHLQAEIYSSGGTMNFTQQGDHHSATVINTSGSMDFLQEGTGNAAEIEKSGRHLTFNQTGDHNTAWLNQSNGNVFFEQSGSFNTGAVEQAEANQRGLISFVQSGDHNTADIYQSGNDLELHFSQAGNNNQADIHQTGFSNYLEIHQNTDGNTLNYRQNGNGNSTVIVQ